MAAIDFSPLQQIDPAGAFFRGQQAAQADAERNMLRQQQVMQFQQAQQDRAFQLEERKKQAEREAQFDKIADLLAQHDMEPDDPKVLSRFMQEAMKARNPQLASVISGMAERAAKRRAEREEAAAVAAAMAPPTLPPGPPLRQNAMAPAAPVNALAAPQQPQNLFAGTPFDIGMGMAAPAAEPTAAPAAAPATAQAARLAELERQRSNLESLPRQTDTSRARLASIDREIARLSPKPLQGEAATMQALGLPLTPEGYARFKSMGQRGTPSETEEIVLRLQDPNLLPASRKALENRLNILTTREPKEPREPKDDPRTVVAFRETDAAGNVTLLNKFGQVITPTAPVKGKPSATFEKTTAQRKQLGLDLDRAITELTDATKKGGLIDQSTGSGAGRLVDIGAGFVGQATPGAIAGGKLAPIADLVLKMVPRFEGPQSDKDTTSYKEAAGQLANTALPNAIRKQAGLEILRLMKERKGQFVSAEMAAEGTEAASAAPAGGGYPAPPAAAVDALKRGQGTDAQFDAIFGPGAAARARGR